jgi:hypothetical protein
MNKAGEDVAFSESANDNYLPERLTTCRIFWVN